MKYLIILITVILVSCVSTKQDVQRSKTNDNLFKITKIQSYPEYSIVYAQRNDSSFKIISSNKNSISSSNSEKICKGKKYNLNLQVIFPLDSLFGVQIMPNSGIKGVRLNGGIVNVEKKTHYKLYQATNLYGMFIKLF